MQIDWGRRLLESDGRLNWLQSRFVDRQIQEISLEIS